MANEIKSTDLVAQSIDFTERFSQSLDSFLQILGVTRKQPMSVGNQIKTYKSTLTLADGNGVVAEGAVIPLSHVKRELFDTKELAYRKFRKQSTAESIQAAGYTQAVTDTDNKLLRNVQTTVKSDLFAGLKYGTTTSGTTFQKALAAALGQLAVKWEDYDIQSVAFVNPLDLYEYLGDAPITLQTVFGVQYIQNFMGVNTMIVSSNVPQGTVYATASENLNYAYASINGEMGTAMGFTSDQTGLIGIKHSTEDDNVTVQTVIMLGGVLFAERVDGVIVSTIGSAPDEVVKPTDANTVEEIKAYLLAENPARNDIKGKTKAELLTLVNSTSDPED